MQKLRFLSLLSLIFVLMLSTANISHAANQSLTGLVTNIEGSHLVFITTKGATYKAEISNAKLIKKNGSVMQFKEFLIGDKIEVFGNVWGDNSISASAVRNLTLYAHNGSFSGKIISLDPSNLSFKLQTSSPEIKIIQTTPLTSFKKNGSGVSFENLEIGMSAKIKGQWERKNSMVTANLVDAKLRYINITITGKLTMKLPGALTIINQNTIYGIDITNAKIVNKSGKALLEHQLNVGDTIKITGKHVSGSIKIIGSVVRNMEAGK